MLRGCKHGDPAHSRVNEYLGDQLEMRDFQYFVSDSSLMDLGYVGPKLTWWNHREGDPIGKKLDRTLANNACS